MKTKFTKYKGIRYCADTEEEYGFEAPEAIVHPVKWLAKEMASYTEYVYRKDGKPATEDDLYHKMHTIISKEKKWPSNLGRTEAGKVRKLDAAITRETFQDVLLAFEKEYHPKNKQEFHQCLVRDSQHLFSKLENLFAYTAERWTLIRDKSEKTVTTKSKVKKTRVRFRTITGREVRYITKPITSKLKGQLLKAQMYIIKLQSKGVDFDDASEAQWVLNDLLTNINGITEALNDRS